MQGRMGMCVCVAATVEHLEALLANCKNRRQPLQLLRMPAFAQSQKHIEKRRRNLSGCQCGRGDGEGGVAAIDNPYAAAAAAASAT